MRRIRSAWLTCQTHTQLIRIPEACWRRVTWPQAELLASHVVNVKTGYYCSMALLSIYSWPDVRCTKTMPWYIPGQKLAARCGRFRSNRSALVWLWTGEVQNRCSCWGVEREPCSMLRFHNAVGAGVLTVWHLAHIYQYNYALYIHKYYTIRYNKLNSSGGGGFYFAALQSYNSKNVPMIYL